MEFFLPAAEPADAERYLAELATFAGRSVPATDDRFESVTFVHNGTEWTAKVGQTLRGEHRVMRRRKNGPTEIVTPKHDPATVLAIFPDGRLWVVVTNARPITGIVSAWENPFYIGDPSVRAGVRFDPPS